MGNTLASCNKPTNQMVAVSCGCLAYTPLRLEISLLALLYAAKTEGEYLWPRGFLEG